MTDFFSRSCRLAAIAAVLFLASPVRAENRVFIIANQADGYGIDQCLAGGESCGAPAARSYCQSREFTKALAFRRVDPDEVTGSVHKPNGASCPRGGCGDYVAITCQR